MVVVRNRLLAILLVTLGTMVSGQNRQEAVVVDEFSNLLCSEYLRSRLDSYYSVIDKKPGSVGYVIVNADAAMMGLFHKYFRIVQKHANFRRLDPARKSYFRGPKRESLHFQFWMVPKFIGRSSHIRTKQTQRVKVRQDKSH